MDLIIDKGLAKRIFGEIKAKNKFLYHGLPHTKDVLKAVTEIARLEGIARDELRLLQAAALFHDRIFRVGRKDNEEKSAAYAEKILAKHHFKKKEIRTITRLILITKLKNRPKTKLEKIMRDADLNNLGRKDFFAWGERLRKESGAEKGKSWWKFEKEFLTRMQFLTASQKKRKTRQLKENLRKIQRKLGH